MNRSSLTRTSTLLLAGLLITACATAQQAPAPQADNTPRWAPEQVAPPQLPKITTPEQMAVRDRANSRWQTLMAGDYAKAYTFTTPTFRKNTTEAAYLEQFEKKPQWHGAEVLTVTCATPASCVAKVRIVVKIALPRTKLDRITTHSDEKWLLEDGQWWLSDDTTK